MRLTLALLLVAVGLAACGGETPGDRGLPTGPPVLRRATSRVRPFGADATLALSSPARIRILYRRDDGDERDLVDRTFPSSYLVELTYTALPRDRTGTVDPLAPVREQREGRTEVHEFRLNAALEGGGGDFAAEPTVWTRPGHAHVRIQATLPSRLGEEVPFGSELELAAIVVADAPTAELTLARRDGWTVPHVEPAPGAEDRLHVLRLILRVEATGDGPIDEHP